MTAKAAKGKRRDAYADVDFEADIEQRSVELDAELSTRQAKLVIRSFLKT
jgi:hypothetical protein